MQKVSYAKITAVVKEMMLLESVPSNGQNLLELGGDSMVARRIAYTLVPHVKSPEAELLRARVLAGLLEGAPFEEIDHILAESVLRDSESHDDEVLLSASNELSPGQYRMWLLWERHLHDASHNILNLWRVSGDLDISALEQSLRSVGERFDAFRARVFNANGNVYVAYDRDNPVSFRYWDLRAAAPSARTEVAQNLVLNYGRTPFSPARGPLLRGQLLRLTNDEWWFALHTHHFAADGFSMSLVYQHINRRYAVQVGGDNHLEDSPPASFRRLRITESLLLTAMRSDEDDEFWKSYLDGAEWPRLLPPDNTGELADPNHGRQHQGILPLPSRDALQSVVLALRATPFELALAGLVATLRRHGGPEDFVIGVVVANRTGQGDDRVVGPLTNTLLVRVVCRGCKSFADIVKVVKETVRKAQSHQGRPLEDVLRLVSPRTGRDHGPISALMVYQNIPPSDLHLEGVRVARLPFDPRVAKFDLMFELSPPLDKGIEFVVEYAVNTYEHSTIERFMERLGTLFLAALNNPAEELYRLQCLSRDDFRILSANDPVQLDYDVFVPVIEQIDKQASIRPHAIAVRTTHDQLTYAELVDASKRIATQLVTKVGTCKNKRVAIWLPPGTDFIASLLAVLRTGAAYLALDPDQGDARFATKLEIVNPIAMITTQDLVAGLGEQSFPIVLLNHDDYRPEQAREAPALITPDTPCHLIFTSGSTGKPKCVVGLHRGLSNRIRWQENEYPIAASERILARVPLSFVDHVAETLAPLCMGAQLVIADPLARASSSALVGAMKSHAITRVTLTPQLLHQCLRVLKLDGTTLPQLRYIFVSGDELRPAVLAEADRLLPACRIINVYGSTEASADATACDVTNHRAGLPIPLGRPLPGVLIRIVDEHLNPVPPGITGEICVGGVGLAAGYLNSEEDNGRAFPTITLETGKQVRMFRTGDLGLIGPDTKILFRGRQREHVVVSGVRVDLCETARRIEMLPEVSECVVVPKELDNGTILVAYVTLLSPLSDSSSRGRILRAKVAPLLRGMIAPSIVEVIPEWPRDEHGKIAYDQLVTSESGRHEDETESFNELERLIARHWSDILERRIVSRSQDFFYEGGDSAKGTEFIFKINREFALNLAYSELRDSTTLGDFYAVVLGALRAAHGNPEHDTTSLQRESFFENCKE